MQIIETSHKEILVVAKCHRAAFPNSFSSQLGTVYVAKMLSWYLDTEKAFIFHLEKNGKVIGYCGGIVNDGTLPTGAASGMTQFSMGAAIKALLLRPWLFFHPELMKRYRFLWRNLKMKFGLYHPELETQKKKDSLQSIGLVVIGVDPKFHGKGYGSKILQTFEKYGTRNNIPNLYLTVKADNYKAIKSYEKNGWKRRRSENNSLSMTKIIK